MTHRRSGPGRDGVLGYEPDGLLAGPRLPLEGA